MSTTGLKRSLEDLPRTLDKTYERILAAIPNEYAEDALRILQWLCVCERPLGLLEVADLIAVDIEQKRYDEDRQLFDPGDILRFCSSLIKVTPRLNNDEEDFLWAYWRSSKVRRSSTVLHLAQRALSSGVIQLAHMSVKAYLYTREIKLGMSKPSNSSEYICNSVLAETSIIYLLQFDVGTHFRAGEFLTSDLLKQRPAASYAAAHWDKHLKRSKTKDHDSLVLRLVSREFHKLVRCLPDPQSGMGLHRYFPSRLEYASYDGVVDLGKLLLELKLKDRQDGFRDDNPLSLEATIRNIHKDMIRLLLKFEGNADGGEFTKTSLLLFAVCYGFQDFAHLVLNAGAIFYLGEALISAAERGLVSIVEHLLRRKTDPDFREYEELVEGYTALHISAIRGHEEIVAMLIRFGADVNAMCFGTRTALQFALTNNHHRIAQMLRDVGAKEVVADGKFDEKSENNEDGGYDGDENCKENEAYDDDNEEHNEDERSDRM